MSKINLKYSSDKDKLKKYAHLKKQTTFDKFDDLHLMYHPLLRIDKDHVVAKLNKSVMINEFIPCMKNNIKQLGTNDRNDVIYQFNNTKYNSFFLKEIIHDCKEKGLLKTNRLDLFFNSSQIFMREDEPCLIKVKNMSYFIAPYIQDGYLEPIKEKEKPEGIKKIIKKIEVQIHESQWVRARDYQ